MQQYRVIWTREGSCANLKGSKIKDLGRVANKGSVHVQIEKASIDRLRSAEPSSIRHSAQDLFQLCCGMRMGQRRTAASMWRHKQSHTIRLCRSVPGSGEMLAHSPCAPISISKFPGDFGLTLELRRALLPFESCFV